MRRRSAFTLIELLTAITIFSILIAIVSTVYVFLIREEQNVATVRKVYAEARDLMDRLVVSAKEGVPDYAFYNNPTALSDCVDTSVSRTNSRFTTHVLAVLDAARLERTVYCASADGVLYTGSASVEASSFDLEPLSSAAISFDYLDFLITPVADPFDPDNVTNDTVQYQPAVTISMQISALSTVKPFILPFVTTISSRVYSR